MRPALALLLLLAAAASASAAEGGTCSDSVPACNRDSRNLEGVKSSSYCLVKFAEDCDYKEGPDSNYKCSVCNLLKFARDDCGTGGRSPPPGSNCAVGYVLMDDEGCAAQSTPPASKWKMVLESKAVRGIEDLLDKGGNGFNKFYAALWGSSLPRNPNPCTGAHGQYVQTYLDKAPYTAMVMNSVEYRSKHQWHAHIGMAKTDLRHCVDKLIAAGAVTKPRHFSAVQKCSFTSPLSGNAIEAQVLLRLEKAADPATSVPKNVGTIITKAAKVMKKLGYTESAVLDFTTLAVTGAKLNNVQYFAVLVINHHDAWSKDPSHLRSGSLGDHVLIVSSPPKK